MCNCGSQPAVEKMSDGRVIDRTNPCEATTVEVLEMYKWAVDCMISKGKYEAANTNEQECLSAQDILSKWILDKIADYKSCTYQNYLPIMQELVKRILLSSICY